MERLPPEFHQRRVVAAPVAAADRLAGVLRPTRDLLQAGRLSPDRARLVTDMLLACDDEIAAAVRDRVLPRASGRRHQRRCAS